MLRPAFFTAAILTGFPIFAGPSSAQEFHGTCQNIYYRGPLLTATCRNALGAYIPSSIDTRTCAPGSISNNNGQLTCYGGGGYGRGYGGGGYGYGRPRYEAEDEYTAPPRYRQRYGY